MNTNQFKSSFYLQSVSGQISETEKYCRIIVKRIQDDSEVIGLETKIKTFDIKQALVDSQFTINSISWGNYYNQTITMLFNLLMLRLNISDIYTVDGKDSIATFFKIYPFHEE